MVPSENLRNVFVEFAHANNLFDRKSEMAKLNEKTAYALATYEIRTENQTPRDKGELQGQFLITLNQVVILIVFSDGKGQECSRFDAGNMLVLSKAFRL